jgi:putative monooxygenase
MDFGIGKNSRRPKPGHGGKQDTTHPGGMVPEHKHENEEEVMYFISGQGKFITADEEIDLAPGICVYNPPGAMHKIVNTGDEDLEFVWIYAPQLASHRK